MVTRMAKDIPNASSEKLLYESLLYKPAIRGCGKGSHAGISVQGEQLIHPYNMNSIVHPAPPTLEGIGWHFSVVFVGLAPDVDLQLHIHASNQDGHDGSDRSHCE